MIAEQISSRRPTASKRLNKFDLLLRTKKGPCLSILVQLFTKSSQRRQNAGLLDHAVEKALRALTAADVSDSLIARIMATTRNLAEGIDLNHSGNGVGLFVSPDIAARVDFPFAVTECIQVGDTFETRDILYGIQYNKPYYVLTLTKQAIHLFNAEADTLNEIRDGYFPRKIYDSYEYARSSRGSSYGHAMKGFEKDKSVLSDIRVSAYLKKADDKLSAYLGNNKKEVVLVGAAKLIHHVEQDHVIAPHVAGKVHGTYEASEIQRLSRAAWQACQEHRAGEVTQLIEKANNSAVKLRAKGIRNVWRAAGEGKGLLLLVEKDLRCPAYIPEGSDQIRLHPPKGRFRMVADAVDDAIETVVLRGGRVVFVPENALAKFERIVLLLRY